MGGWWADDPPHRVSGKSGGGVLITLGKWSPAFPTHAIHDWSLSPGSSDSKGFSRAWNESVHIYFFLPNFHNSISRSWQLEPYSAHICSTKPQKDLNKEVDWKRVGVKCSAWRWECLGGRLHTRSALGQPATPRNPITLWWIPLPLLQPRAPPMFVCSLLNSEQIHWESPPRSDPLPIVASEGNPLGRIKRRESHWDPDPFVQRGET